MKFLLKLSLLCFLSPIFAEDNVIPQTDVIIQKAVSYYRNHMFLEALDTLQTIDAEKIKKISINDEEGLRAFIQIKFYELASHYYLLNKEEAENHAEKLLDFLGNDDDYYRERQLFRYVVLTKTIKENLSHWNEGDLGEVHRLMQASRQHLQTEPVEGKRTTQENLAKADQKQKKAIEILDELIKQKENQQNGGGGGQASDQQKDASADASANGGKKGDQHLTDSKIGGESGKGEVHEKKLKALAEKWGTMPDRERAKAMQELTKDYPARYRQVIEDFFKTLSKSPK